MTEKNLLIATTNQGKVREIKRLLQGLRLQIHSLKDHPSYGRYEEKGETFEENSRGKSLFYSRLCPGLVLAEDSGLEVQALGGAPGVYSARFSDPGATDQKNIIKLLKLLENVPGKQRRARFISAVTLSSAGRVIKTFKGVVRGKITMEPRGKSGFGYDPVFFHPPSGKTFAELPPAEKNQVSHRGQALGKVRRFLFEYLKKNSDRVIKSKKKNKIKRGKGKQTLTKKRKCKSTLTC